MQPEGFVEVCGQRLEYRFVAGRTAGPVVMLLHEGLGSVSLWRDFPERLAAATGLAVFCWSRAGYGRSSPCALPRPLDYMHDEARRVLPALIAALGFPRIVLTGHSDGASIAAIHAGSAAGPELAGLILMAPHFFVEDVSVTSIEAARAAWQAGDLRERLRRHHGDNVDCAFLGWNGAWLDPGFRSWNIERFLPRIAVPALVIQGEDDEYGTMAQVDAYARLAGAPCRVLKLADCGHSPQKDQTEVVLAAAAQFLSGVS